MTAIFYVSAAVAILSTAMVVTRLDAVHALLYLIVSLLAVALAFVTLGAPFAAALEVIIYAGAIMVLFVFVVMILDLGPRAREQERRWLRPGIWIGPGTLLAILLAELVSMLFPGTPAAVPAIVGPREVGVALYGPYLLGVELASMLLLAGLVGAYHIAQRTKNMGGPEMAPDGCTKGADAPLGLPRRRRSEAARETRAAPRVPDSVTGSEREGR